MHLYHPYVCVYICQITVYFIQIYILKLYIYMYIYETFLQIIILHASLRYRVLDNGFVLEYILSSHIA